MSWLAVGAFLKGALKYLVAAAVALFKWTLKHPWQALCIALLCASVWLWRGWNRADHRSDTWHQAYTLQKQASDTAAKAQRAANARDQTAYQGSATNAQARFRESTPRVHTATDSFILHGGVRPALCPPGGSNPPAAPSDPAVLATVPADSNVAVSNVDVHRCADADNYAVEAHNLIQDWLAKGLAVAAKGAE